VTVSDWTAGGYTLTPVKGSSLWLDGGAMFGVVPKAMWKDRTESDDRNRIHLAADPLLLQGNGRTILFEGSTSFNFDEKKRDIYGVAGEGLVADLERLGVAPGDVDLVVMTHLHFDHAGGLVRRGGDGGLVPTFPNARIAVQKGELEDSLNPPDIRAASYRTGDIELLREAGLFEPVEGKAVVADGIFVEPGKSHTRCHQTIRVGEKEDGVVFVGDLIPTSAHINPAWIMAYDLYPLDCAQVRKEFLARAEQEGWTLYFYHDPRFKAGTISRNERGAYTFHPRS
jgi:glyoxylase-like metal-dependent hydrolase (beta-lactamase superfamily II)